MDATSASVHDIARLTAPFEQRIEPVRVSALYRLALIFVAIAMVLLPLLYVSLVIAVGWGLFVHATQSLALFDALGGRGGSVKLALFLYLAPLVVGAILLLFMIKPIFARLPKPSRPVSLDPDEEPTLFAFVERLSAAVGASAPVRIDVDHQVNASAGFRRGIRSMFGNDLVLTIGLPLVDGMTLRQFAGVLAHEFGHFAQGTGMRLTYVIRSVNHWFARVVYERDVWDIRLDQLAKESDIRLGVVLHVARFFVWLTRRILWALMMAGHVISCFMLRNMEYDADRYEARVAGSREFETTVHRLQELGVANQQAMGTLQNSWRSGRLADDVPALISFSAGRLPTGVDTAIRENLDSQRTGALDTHPSDRDRIASARRENSEGVFRLQEPARTLFCDFEGLSKRVTVALYRQQFGGEVPTERLVPSEELIAGERDLEASMELVRRYFNGVVPVSPPLTFQVQADLSPAEDRDRACRELLDARRAVEEGAGEARVRGERYRELDEKAARAASARHLVAAGFRLDPDAAGLPAGSSVELEQLVEQTVAELRAVREAGADYEQVVQRRIRLALRLARDPEVAAKIDGTDTDPETARRMLDALACLGEHMDRIEALRRDFSSYSSMLHVLQNHKASDTAVAELWELANALFRHLGDLRERLDAPHPFECGPTIGTDAVEQVADRQDFGALHACADTALDRIFSLWKRTLACLVERAHAIETAVGLPPLPAPADDS